MGFHQNIIAFKKKVVLLMRTRRACGEVQCWYVWQNLICIGVWVGLCISVMLLFIELCF